MLSRLVQALVDSKNEAADDVLLEALRLGTEPEKALALNALLRRHTNRGLMGVIAQYGGLPEEIQLIILQNIKLFHAALRECGRGRDPQAALSAMKLIALGRQGKLTFVLSEGLHGGDEAVAHAAVEAMVALARWVATETRRLQRGDGIASSDGSPVAMVVLPDGSTATESEITYRQLIEDRPEIEKAVARALEVHRGKHGQELLRAALLLADWPGSKTLAILNTAKHGGQSAMIRRLQQTPDSEHVEAFLLGASLGGLRNHFSNIFARIAEAPVLDAILRKTHWLKDHQLQMCMRQVTRGLWWTEADLERDLSRRDDADGVRIADWIAASGTHDVVQDDYLERIRLHVNASLSGRLRLLRLAMGRGRGGSIGLLRTFLADGDERLMRMAAREIVRRRPADFENMLIPLVSAAPLSVRRVMARSVGQAGFDSYWDRFERLDHVTRRAAGRAMFKLLPDSVQRLERRLRSGPLEQRLRALVMAQELGVADGVQHVLVQLCQDSNPKLRSKAVAVLAELKTVPPEVVLEKALTDTDARVRANAIEVLEATHRTDYLPMLTQRARSSSNRERANAIKALYKMRVGTATEQLANMMRDDRAEHRISALWALRQIGWWQMIHEVGRLAKEDANLRVRRYAMAVLRGVADMLQETKRRAAG